MSDKVTTPKFPRIYHGISTMKCGLCEFEFVYVEPEETQSSYVVIGEHITENHPGLQVAEVPVTQTRY